MRGAARRGGLVERLRHRAERREIALDQAGIDFALHGIRSHRHSLPRNARLLRGPAISVRSSASASLSSAASRVGRMRDELGDHRDRNTA